jgi:hypothetical protein
VHLFLTHYLNKRIEENIMKVLTTTTIGRSVSIVCNQIVRVEEHGDSHRSWIFTTDGQSVVVDMPYLEVVGFLKSID